MQDNRQTLTPIRINTPQALSDLVSILRNQSQVGVDTESNSLYAYQEQVCLIQFSTTTHDYLIDPFAIPDLMELAEIFQNPSIEKIFHAAEYDIICLRRDYDFCFVNIFDTMLAARILGIKEIGLNSFLESHFGVAQNKRYQRADWGKRPLLDEMLTYAAADTHYLIDLESILKQELLKRNLWELAQEDFERISQCRAREAKSMDEAWHISGSQNFTARQLAVLKRVWEYRDRKALHADKPPFKVFSNQTLLDLAEKQPKTLAEIALIKGMNEKLARYHGEGLLAAIKHGQKDPPPPPEKKRKRPDTASLQRLDKLKHWRHATADSLGVESDVVLPRDKMEQIAFLSPSQTDQLMKIMSDLPWRYKRFGQEISQLLDTPNHPKEQ